jgi:hypothetical protein
MTDTLLDHYCSTSQKKLTVENERRGEWKQEDEKEKETEGKHSGRMESVLGLKWNSRFEFQSL